MTRFRKSFSAKMLGITLSLFLLFCAVSTTCWYQSFTQEAVNTAEENISSLIDVLTDNFEKNVRDVDYIAALISNKVPTQQNNCLIQYLTVEEKESARLVEQYQETKNYLLGRCSFKSYLNGMAVYNFDGRTCSYGITAPYSELVSEEWFEQVKEGTCDVVYIAPHDYTSSKSSPGEKQVFSLIRPILYHDEVIGMVKADIKCSLLETIFDIQNMNGYELCVIDNNTEELIYAPENKTVIAPEMLTRRISGEQGRYSETISGTEYLVVYTSAAVTPWTVVGVVEKSSIISGFIQVRQQMLMMVGLCIGLLVVSALFVTKIFTRDLRALSSAVLAIQGEDLQLEVDIRSEDEVGTLYQQICAMLERIRMMIADIQQKEAEKRVTEIRMLSMQINPHFLYNTLHTIKVLAIMQGMKNIEKVSDALSNMLHLNLDARKFISIAEEERYLLDYLNIQEYRYVGKFTYQVSVETGIQDYMVPKLLIQPIVENALQHGIAVSEAVGFVQVRIFREGEQLQIVVKNSGRAFDPALLNGSSYRGRESSHIGLHNIERRLKLLFGDRGTLKIFSEPDLFTIVELTMPVIRKEEVFHYDENYGS